jgi:ketosteroid isomerase-like protein
MLRAATIHMLLGWGVLLASQSYAQEIEPDAEDPAHEQLRELRGGLVAAIEKNDLDGILDHLHKDVVVTWLDGRQSRGHEQVREYFNRMMKGEKPIVKSYSIEDVEVKELTLLYGDDTGVAYGTASSHFVLTDGRDLVIGGPWTATMVNEDGNWTISAFHSSVGMFDNPVLRMATGWITKAAVIAGVIGFMLGAGVVLLLKRGRSKSEGQSTA